MSNLHRLSPLTCALFVFAHAAQAEPAQLPPVTVTGTRVPDAPLHAGATHDALRTLAGGSLAPTAGGGSSALPSIRGLASDRIRVKIDGMDLVASCPNHMNPPLALLDPATIAQAAIFAGISPVSLGGDSIAGSVVVETRPARFVPDASAPQIGGEAGARVQSNGTVRSAQLAAHRASDRLYLGLDASTSTGGTRRAGGEFKTYTFTGRAGHTLARDAIGSTRHERHTLNLHAAWRAGDEQIDLRYGAQRVPFEGFPNQRMDMTDNRSDRLQLAWRGARDWGALDARLYHERTDHEMNFLKDKRFWYGPASGGNNPPGGNAMPCAPIGPTCAAGMPMSTRGRTTGATAGLTLPMAGGSQLRTGIEIHHYTLDDTWAPSGAMMFPGTFVNIRDGRRNRHALYAEWTGTLGAGLSALAGLRHESVHMNAGPVSGYAPTNAMGSNQLADSSAFNARSRKRHDANWDATLLLRGQAAPGLDFELGLAQKTRSPNLFERYTWSTWQMAALMNNFVGDGNGYVGNLDLRPEIARTASASLMLSDPESARWHLRITPHASLIEDYIDATRLPGQTGTQRFVLLRYRNADAQIAGVELDAAWQVARQPAGHTTLRAQGSVLSGKNRETQDRLHHILPATLTLALDQRWQSWQVSLENELMAGKKRVSAERNEIPTAGYGLVHLRARYAGRHYTLDFGVENVFDRLYAHPLSGAYVGQGTTMTNPPLPNYPQWGTPVPGVGRNAYVALRYVF